MLCTLCDKYLEGLSIRLNSPECESHIFHIHCMDNYFKPISSLHCPSTGCYIRLIKSNLQHVFIEEESEDELINEIDESNNDDVEIPDYFESPSPLQYLETNENIELLPPEFSSIDLSLIDVNIDINQDNEKKRDNFNHLPPPGVPYSIWCPICPEIFTNRTAKSKHMVAHRDPERYHMRFNCLSTTCTKTFGQKTSMMRHYKEKHGETIIKRKNKPKITHDESSSGMEGVE